MKKIISILIVFIIAGCAVFFRGWTQAAVPHGSYAVLRSKTHGLYAKTIESGHFTWLWYRLIPANTAITVFNVKNQTVQIDAEGDLPQSDVYASFVGVNASFAWKVSGTASFSIDPESLPSLTEQFGISDQSGLDAHNSELCSLLLQFIEQRLSYYCGQKDVIEKIDSGGGYQKLDDDIRAAFPCITKLSCQLTVKKLPGFEMYEAAKDLYDDYIGHQREVLNIEITENAAERIRSQFRMDELARYGDLLTKYPILLEYLKLNLAERNGSAP
jgi:hypothetical protein